MIVLAAIGGGRGGGGNGEWVAAGSGGVLFFPMLLMIVFRQKYPRWWYDWNLELLRFENRVFVYLGLMDDRYPVHGRAPVRLASSFRIQMRSKA